MNICIVTPAPKGSRKGNRITALRWTRILRSLGHRVWVAQSYEHQPCDVLIALHARRSAESVLRVGQDHPAKPIVLALTGTDLYDDIHHCTEAQEALQLAWRLVVLQPLGIQELPQDLQNKTRVILQSVQRLGLTIPHKADVFEVCVIGHLRPVKDPFRTALAARSLPASSKIRILHIGAALSPEMAQQASAEQAQNPRYRWLGEMPRRRTRQILAQSRLCVLTSKMEGGANVISEALADGVPMLSSRIPGSIGILGEGYPGYFSVGDTEALAALLQKAETDEPFYRSLQEQCTVLAPLVDPQRERQAWAALLSELSEHPRR